MDFAKLLRLVSSSASHFAQGNSKKAFYEEIRQMSVDY